MMRSLLLCLLLLLSAECSAQRDSLLIVPYDTLFSLIEPELVEISKTDFTEFHRADSLRQCSYRFQFTFLRKHGLNFVSECKEICESFLVDSATGKKLLLPSDYDQGIMDLKVSPDSGQFMVYSSYDMPSYSEYYFHRAEIYVFNIGAGKGLEPITPSLRFYTQDWSIDEVIWVSNDTIAMKVYEGDLGMAGHGLAYTYFKFNLR